MSQNATNDLIVNTMDSDLENLGKNPSPTPISSNPLKSIQPKESPFSKMPIPEKKPIETKPFSPHISEEIWSLLGYPYSIHNQLWPEVDEEAAKEEEITLVIQINGKVRDRITVPADISDEDAKTTALATEQIHSAVQNKEIKKIIVVPKKLINIVL